MSGVLLAAGEVWTNPIIVGVVVGLPASVLGVLAYRRTEAKDREAALAVEVAAGGAAIQRVVDGLNQIIANLQGDNAVLRSEKSAMRDSLTDLTKQLKECNDDLAQRIAGQTPPS